MAILTIEVTSILPKLHVNKCYNNLLCKVRGGVELLLRTGNKQRGYVN